VEPFLTINVWQNMKVEKGGIFIVEQRQKPYITAFVLAGSNLDLAILGSQTDLSDGARARTASRR
jgi:hypothetical protein